MHDALQIQRLSSGYGETVVLEDIDLKLAPGECISVIGRNGVGKTTLLATIMGHTTLHSGELWLDGEALNGMPCYRRALAGIGFEATEVELVADPEAPGNMHEIEAEGAAGRFAIKLQGKPSRTNPKTSALAALSVARALVNLEAPIVI